MLRCPFGRSLYEDFIDSDSYQSMLHLPLCDAEPTIMYYVHDGRNAWHTTWVQRYFPANFAGTWVDARNSVEPRRVQGSKWWIYQMPCLGLRFPGWDVLVSELNCQEILKGCVDVEWNGPFLPQVVEALRECEFWHKAVVMVQPSRRLKPIGIPLRGHASVSRGGEEPLEWTHVPGGDYSRRFVESVSERLRERMKHTPYHGAVLKDTHSGLVEVIDLLQCSALGQMGVERGASLRWAAALANQGRLIDGLTTQATVGASADVIATLEGREIEIDLRIPSLWDATQLCRGSWPSSPCAVG